MRQAPGGYRRSTPHRQPVQHHVSVHRVVAYQHHVAARAQRRCRACIVATSDTRAFHRQIVAENHAVETILAAQNIADPFAGKTRRCRINFRVNHMGRHHRRQTGGNQLLVGQHVFSLDQRVLALINRHFMVRVGANKAMPRKMLAARGQPALTQAALQCRRQRRHDRRVTVKRAVPNHPALAIIKIEHWCEAQIHPAGTQLSRQHIAAILRQLQRAVFILIPHFTQLAHRWNGGEAVAKALHPPALVIHRDDEVIPAQRANPGGQRTQLRHRLVMPRKQNHPAQLRMKKASSVCVVQAQTIDIGDYHTQR